MSDREIQTGVGILLRCAHADKVTGAVHGHTYEAVCWFSGKHNAEKLQDECPPTWTERVAHPDLFEKAA